MYEQRPDDVAGVAGLAYQAVDLAMKVLTLEIDGSDAGGHRARMERTQQLVQVEDRQLAFLWEVRQRDFYGDVSRGGASSTPASAEVIRALDIATGIVDSIDRELHATQDTTPFHTEI